MKFAQFIGQLPAHLRSDFGVLQEDRALEILTAMQAGSQDKVAVEQRAGFAKKREEILAHLGSGRRGDLAAPNAFGVANFSWLGVSFGLLVLEAFRRGRRNVHAGRVRSPALQQLIRVNVDCHVDIFRKWQFVDGLTH